MPNYLMGCMIYSTKISPNDFTLTAPTTQTAPGVFSIQIIVDAFRGGDVSSLVSATVIDLFDDINAVAPVATLPGPVNDVSGTITFPFAAIAQIPANTSNSWKIRFGTLDVLAANGTPMTLTNFVITFVSPFAA